MIFADANNAGGWIFFLVFIMLALKGMGQAFGKFDKGGAVHGAAQKGAVGLIERLFKR